MGEESFEFSIIVKCAPRDVVYYEQKFIDEMRPAYNAAMDVVAPMQGRKHSEETKAKIGAAHLGIVVGAEGRKICPSHKRLFSAQRNGTPQSHEA